MKFLSLLFHQRPHFWVACLVLLVSLGPSAASMAASGSPLGLSRLPHYSHLRSEIASDPSPGAYVGLRQLWQNWDQGDPLAVEATLSEIASDPRVRPPVRVYAGLLNAYARRRLGDLEGARRIVRDLGYIDKWWILGPFDNEGKTGLLQDFGPERNLDFGRPSSSPGYEGKERTVHWRLAPTVSPFGWFDFGTFLRPSEKICAYATTFVRREPGKAQGPAATRSTLWVGSGGAFRAWWNGHEVLRDGAYRNLDAERLASPVTLREGWNQIVVKVCGDDNAPMISLRVGTEDGAPRRDLEVSADPDLRGDASEAPPAAPVGTTLKSPGATEASWPKGQFTPQSVPQRIEGPLQAFERLSRSPSAAILEGYGRYLVLTQGDDPAERKARELARRSAEMAPTVSRLLFAGRLAEDRNQRASWIEKAERRIASASPEEKLELLLARGDHLRTGANWRDALPIYDRALDLDPDNATALLAKNELFAAAGLRSTGISLLEGAVHRRPQSVALLRALVDARRADNRTSEAEDAALRYSQWRFDDVQFLRSRVHLAVARRNVPSAVRWIDRLLEVAPDRASEWLFAAGMYTTLGDQAKSMALYRRCLELAPEDTTALRALADAHGIHGQDGEQTTLLRKLLELRPQEKDVRDYLTHKEPSKPRPDETYAKKPEEFLPWRSAQANGLAKRTLVRLQVTTVFPNGLASRFHQEVFQPLTEAAAAELREYAFAFQADTETVQLRGARVYRADGRIEEAIETGEGNTDNPSLSMYTSARAFYVHFPRLNPGDVVEIQYRVEDVAERNVFSDYFGQIVELQGAEPIRFAQYVLITPKSRTFYFGTPNVPGLQRSEEEKGSQRIYRFVAENVAPIEPEPHQPPFSELVGRIHVSTFKDWNAMGQWYWGLVRDQFIPDDEVKQRVAEITKGLTSDLDKVRAVYAYVVQKTRYVALEFGIHGYKPYRCAQIFARGFGDCKDKATLIVTMLRELGIPSTIVILRTNLRGDFPTDLASLSPFDHAIAYVPSLDLYLDGTAEFTGSSELPVMDRGALGLLVNEGKPKIVHLPNPPASESVLSKRIEATIQGEGGATIDWRGEASGYFAPSWRQRYHAASQRKTRLQEELSKELAGFQLTASDASDLEDLEVPAKVHAKGKVTTLGRRDGGNLSIPAGPREHFVRDYASLSERRLEVRLPAQSTHVTEWVLHIPPGHSASQVPVASEGNSAFGSFKVEVEASASVIRTKTTVTVTRTRIPASEYKAFKAWCERVDGALGQRVIVTL